LLSSSRKKKTLPFTRTGTGHGTGNGHTDINSTPLVKKEKEKN